MTTIKTLRALEQAADAAPWIYSKKRRCVDTAQVCDDGTRCDLDEIPLSGMDDRPGAADANGSLIAALRNAAPALIECASILRELLTECPSTLDEATFPKRGITDANRKQVVFMLSVSADRIKRGEDALAALEEGKS